MFSSMIKGSYVVMNTPVQSVTEQPILSHSAVNAASRQRGSSLNMSIGGWRMEMQHYHLGIKHWYDLEVPGSVQVQHGHFFFLGSESDPSTKMTQLP